MSELDRQPPGHDVRWWHGLLAFVLVVVVVYGSWRLIDSVDPGQITMPEDPGFLELLVADRTVLTVLRVAVIFGLGYVIWSVFQLIRTGRFLTSLPGVSVSDAAARLSEASKEAAGGQAALEEALKAANEDIAYLLQYVDELQTALAKQEDRGEDESGAGV